MVDIDNLVVGRCGDVIERAKTVDPWKVFREAIWRAGYFKVDRWSEDVLGRTHERFLQCSTNIGDLFPIMKSIYLIDPNCVSVERMFRMCYVLLGFECLMTVLQDKFPLE